MIIGDFKMSCLMVGSVLVQLGEIMRADILVPQELQKLSEMLYPKTD
mgnify:CR=1 FL=1